MLQKYSLNNYSRFWIDSQDTNAIDELLGIEHDKQKGRDLVALSSYRRAISNFVNIVSGKSIPVEFNSNDQSYTDGKKVILGANLNDKNFDIAVGLALHEGSHILLSDFDLLNKLSANIPDALYDKSSKLGIGNLETLSRIKRILNYIEDKRIDYYIFKTSPGYKGYYHAMYAKYHYNAIVDKALKSAEYRTEIWDSYDFRLINLENSNRQLNALNGLRDIWNEINLPRIYRLTSSSDALEVALEVYDIILNNIDPIIKPENSSSKEDEDGKLNEREGGDEFGSGSSSLNKDKNDDGSELTEMTESQKKQLPRIIEKQKDFVDDKIKKTKLSKKDSSAIQSLEESGATYEEVGEGASWYGSKVKCLVVKNLTANLINSEVFSCASKWNIDRYDSKYSESNFVEEGLRLGNILGKKLKVRSEERITKYNRKDAGKIDKRMLAELGFGNTNVFSQTLIDRYNKAYLHISIDASGSMGGKKWNKAMTSAVAMIKACDMAGNIDVVVSIRSTHGDYRTDVPLIMVVYDSRKDKLTKVRTLFKALRSAGTTPEGLCFEAITKDMIPGNSNQDSYFINYSDGQPIFSSKDYSYSGHSAEKHTEKQVNKMRNLGLKVISYFISDYESDREHRSFKAMYGKDAQFINATNMMEVARSMNKKFLEK
jgi:hypothetical protein|tara:strand:+ start:804 stop:2774 length:1971 start_codon:yes stop_codon:yes gene_type:complete